MDGQWLRCNGTVPDPADCLCRLGDPRRGLALRSRPGRPGAGPRLGADAAGRRRRIRLDSVVDRDLPGPRDRADRLRLQPLRRRAARRPRLQTPRPLSVIGSEADESVIAGRFTERRRRACST